MPSRFCVAAARGLMAAGIVVSLAATAAATPLTLTNAGFETDEPTAGMTFNGLPSTTGQWEGDDSRRVTAEQGIAPFEGEAMLRFLSSANPAAGWGWASDVWQLIDAAPAQSVIQAGEALVTFSAHFNRIGGNTEPLFFITLRAFGGLPADFPLAAESPLATANAFLTSDDDPNTWEPLSVTLLLPPGTTFIGVRLAAKETIDDTPVPFEFLGHYADGTSLTLTPVPEPATALLVLSGAAGLIARRRRSRSGQF
ncbi:MAG: PEP-CTERM sorting domain-containing protein [Acidobacteria bacterium]|nr:PEP-CTERM sorting domain-containing protein [Acidobacteriota bacterium]